MTLTDRLQRRERKIGAQISKNFRVITKHIDLTMNLLQMAEKLGHSLRKGKIERKKAHNFDVKVLEYNTKNTYALIQALVVVEIPGLTISLLRLVNSRDAFLKFQYALRSERRSAATIKSTTHLILLELRGALRLACLSKGGKLVYGFLLWKIENMREIASELFRTNYGVPSDSRK